MIRQHFKRSRLAVAGAAAATAVAAAGLVLVPPAMTSASAADTCTGSTDHRNVTTTRKAVAPGAERNAHDGPYEACGVRFNPPSGQMDLHCWVANEYGNAWWFLDTDLRENVTGKQGWVWSGDLSYAPQLDYNENCGGRVGSAP